jgi:hypothetical protein
VEVSLLSHVTNSALIVYLLQFLKRTGWYRRFCAWAPMEEQKVHVLMSAIGAWGTSMGMHGAVAGSSVAGWTLTLAIPPLWVIFHALWDFAQQFALNQIVYAMTLQQKEAAPVGTVQVSPAVSVTAPISGDSAAARAS